mmetsp:Transcript_6031/g.24075  ORF Transcript_6031/g.24075 Transcript_6031/m.24075 type:complete len:383 (-) Transcript_6031:571-1719(-)
MPLGRGQNAGDNAEVSELVRVDVHLSLVSHGGGSHRLQSGVEGGAVGECLAVPGDGAVNVDAQRVDDGLAGYQPAAMAGDVQADGVLRPRHCNEPEGEQRQHHPGKRRHVEGHQGLRVQVLRRCGHGAAQKRSVVISMMPASKLHPLTFDVCIGCVLQPRPRGAQCSRGLEVVMEFSVWLAFFAASWAISLSPGAGAVAAMSSGLSHGFRRGYFMTFGLILGILTQVVLVSAGLGALIAASSLGFALVKWAGVAYLIWLGVQQWRAPAKPLVAAEEGAVQVTRRQLVLRGWGINAVNPKGTVFLLAVVPQFLDLHAPLGPQYLVIGATLGFTDLVVMAGYTALAARVLAALRSEHHIRVLNRVFGSLFVAAGLLLASFKRAA